MEIKPLDSNLCSQSLGGQRTASTHSGDRPAPAPWAGPPASIPNSLQVTLSDASRMLLETEQTAAPAKGNPIEGESKYQRLINDFYEITSILWDDAIKIVEILPTLPNRLQVTLSDASRMLLETEQTVAPAKGNPIEGESKYQRRLINDFYEITSILWDDANKIVPVLQELDEILATLVQPGLGLARYEVARTQMTNFLNKYLDSNEIKLFCCLSAPFLLDMIREAPLARTQKAAAFATAGAVALTAAIKAYSEEM